MKPVRAQVALARVGKNGEEALSTSQFAGDNTACMKNRSRRNAAQDSFICTEAASGGTGFIVGNGHNPIDYVSI